MMNPQEQVRQALHAFVDLILEPFEQDLYRAIRAAATAGTLAFALGVFVPSGNVTASAATLVLLLLWASVTAVIVKRERRKAVARNLGVASLWLAVTQLLVLLAEMIRPSVVEGDLRFAIVLVALLVLVPTHMFRNLAVRSAIGMTLVLLVTTTSLAGLLIYDPGLTREFENRDDIKDVATGRR